MSNQYSPADSALVDALIAISARSPKLVKSTIHDAPADTSIKVRSWKMNEHKYYTVPSPFPTLARGIFTTSEEPGNRIVIRGYDKFFNIGEVPWTTWPAIERRTSAPYTLSLKSNGCIIFIGALTQDKLLITSKHAIGTLTPDPKSHAQAGERWLRKYFEQKGKTEAELAKLLWDNNWTLIAELCDDSFEEHVLPYPPEKSGLHLHGINETTTAFRTLPHTTVDAIAAEWGFIATKHITLNTVEEIREFTSGVEKAGHWEGEAVEGFVVRTHVCDPPKNDSDRSEKDKSPYSTGSTFFFKIKFDEPYMMYRDWREVTKVLLNAPVPSEDVIGAHRKKRAETRVYLRWIIQEIKRDRTQFDAYSHNHGIIATRERFLAWLETEDGKAALEAAKANKDKPVVVKVKKGEFGKTIILPVAIPGCGKTTVAVALAHLFNFGHTQSDDVQAKKPAPLFIKNVVSLLDTYDVVIADKNNHLKQHRDALRMAATPSKSKRPAAAPVRLLALNWSFTDLPPAIVHRVCTDRIMRRGENHQTLIADPDAFAHESVVWEFINKTEPLQAFEVDEVVEMSMNIGEDGQDGSVVDNLKRAVDGIVRVLDLERPSDEAIMDAVKVAEKYAVNVGKREEKQAEKNQKNEKGNNKVKEKGKNNNAKVEKTVKKPSEPRYFGFLAELDLTSLLDKQFLSLADSEKRFYVELKDKKRIQPRPHVTIVHTGSRKDEQKLWDRSSEVARSQGVFVIKLGRVLWDDRVMVLVVDSFDAPGEDKDQVRADFVSKLPFEVRQRMHITVGTKSDNIKPFEGKGLIERWRKGGEEAEGIEELKLSEAVDVNGRIKGLFG